MMARAATAVLLSVGLALSAVPACAQATLEAKTALTENQTPGPPAKLTLAAAIDAAQANFPRVRAALEQQRAAQAAVGVARSAYLPHTDVLWQTNRATANNIYGLLLPQPVISSLTGPVLPGGITRSAWSSAGGALFSWQPFDFGARGAQVKAAQHGAAAAAAGANLTKLDVGLAAANAYFDLAAAQQLARTATANVKRLEVFANTVHVLVNNQLRAGAEAAQADAQFAFAKTQMIQAETAVAVRRAALEQLVGGPVGELDDASLLGSMPPELNQAEGQTAAHPGAQQQAALVGEQKAKLTFLQRSYVPQFNFMATAFGRGAGTSPAGTFPGGSNGLAPNTANWATGIQMTFPAFQYFNLRAQKKAQESTVRAEQAKYEQVLSDISTQVKQAEAQLVGAKQIAQNTPIELQAAQQSESQQRARFQSGLATVIDVAAAESTLVQAEADDAVARINVWRALAAVAGARGDLQPFLKLIGGPH